jgi:hypothetical protein
MVKRSRARVDDVVGVRHVLILEGAHDQEQRVVGGHGVEQRPGDAGLGRALAKAGDVVVSDLGIGRLLGVEHGRQPIDAHVGHVDHGGVDLDLAAGKGCRSPYRCG